MKRVERAESAGRGSHFLAPSSGLTFIPTGSTALDQVISGGWCCGRMSNIVGDKSTGKTLLAIEGFANFNRKFPGELMWYREAESAFDISYAQAIGMPVDKIKFIDKKRPFNTVEDFYEDLEKCCNRAIQKRKLGLYVLDSLDALSDRKEMERGFSDNTYGQDKPRQMSALFRRVTRLVEESQIALLTISQTRANIGVSFGKNYKRSGGQALDFYASIVLYLANRGRIKKTRKGEERVVGVNIIAMCEKNKVGLPFRKCEFPIRFAYGIEDLQSCVKYLKDRGKLSEIDMSKAEAKEILTNVDSLDNETYNTTLEAARKALRRQWRATEQSFLPTRVKYAD